MTPPANKRIVCETTQRNVDSEPTVDGERLEVLPGQVDDGPESEDRAEWVRVLVVGAGGQVLAVRRLQDVGAAEAVRRELDLVLDEHCEVLGGLQQRPAVPQRLHVLLNGAPRHHLAGEAGLLAADGGAVAHVVLATAVLGVKVPVDGHAAAGVDAVSEGQGLTERAGRLWPVKQDQNVSIM